MAKYGFFVDDEDCTRIIERSWLLINGLSRCVPRVTRALGYFVAVFLVKYKITSPMAIIPPKNIAYPVIGCIIGKSSANMFNIILIHPPFCFPHLLICTFA